MTINNENDLLEAFYDYRSEDGNHCHGGKNGNCKGVKLNEINEDFYNSVNKDGHKILDRLLLGHKIGYYRDENNAHIVHYDTSWGKCLYKDSSFVIMPKGTNLVEKLRDAESVNSKGKIYLEAADKTKNYVIWSCVAIIISSIFSVINNGCSIYERAALNKISKKEGSLQSHIEEYHKQEHNPIGDQNENSTQQTDNNAGTTKTDKKNVCTKEGDERDRTSHPIDRESNTKNNTREELELDEEPIPLSSMSKIPISSNSVKFDSRTNGGKLLLPLSNKKKISDSKSKKESVE